MPARPRTPVAWALAVVVAVTACARLSPPSPPAPAIRIGLAYDAGGRGDLSFNDMAYAGLSRARKRFGGRLEAREGEPGGAGGDRDRLLRTLAEEGADLVVAVGAAFAGSVRRVAEQVPGVTFVLVGGSIPRLRSEDRIACLVFKAHEGSFLMGAAAALASRTGVIGFVGGASSPPAEPYEVGYVAGAKYIDPGIAVLVDSVGATAEALPDPARGREAALRLYARGADVVYHAAQGAGAGVFEAAAAVRKLAIGSGADQSLTARDEWRDRILTSMVERVDIAVYEAIAAFAEGRLPGGCRSLGLAEGGVGYAENDFNRQKMAAIRPRLEEVKARIIAGRLVVPSTRAGLDAFLRTRPR